MRVDQNAIDEASLRQGRTFVWHELYTPDLTAGLKFYETALGLGSTSMDMGEMGSYTMLTRDGKTVCGVHNTSAPMMAGVPPHWAVYLAVDDVDARVKAVEANGGKLVVPAMDVPTVGRMALIADPQGAHIWLFKGE